MTFTVSFARPWVVTVTLPVARFLVEVQYETSPRSSDLHETLIELTFPAFVGDTDADFTTVVFLPLLSFELAARAFTVSAAVAGGTGVASAFSEPLDPVNGPNSE